MHRQLFTHTASPTPASNGCRITSEGRKARRTKGRTNWGNATVNLQMFCFRVLFTRNWILKHTAVHMQNHHFHNSSFSVRKVANRHWQWTAFGTLRTASTTGNDIFNIFCIRTSNQIHYKSVSLLIFHSIQNCNFTVLTWLSDFVLNIHETVLPLTLIPTRNK
jgi:hypothetical protein